MLAEYGGLMGLTNPRVEEMVQDCMADEGFDYALQPVEPWGGWRPGEAWLRFTHCRWTSPVSAGTS